MIDSLSTVTALLPWLAETSVQVAALCVLLLGIEAIAWRTISPRARFALWSLVILRAMMPSLPNSWLDVPRVVDWSMRTTETPVAATPRATEVLALAPPREPPAARASAKREPVKPTDGLVEPRPKVVPSVAANPAPIIERDDPSREPATPSTIRASALSIAWILGFVVTVLATVWREVRFRTRLRRSSATFDPTQLAEITALAREMKMTRFEVHATDLVTGPASAGITAPRLLLPTTFFEDYPVEARRSIVLHEFAHLRHRDSAWNALLVLVQAVHWFNPLLHLAVRRLRASREQVRDADALSVSNSPSPDRYARTLLDVLERASLGTTRGTVPAIGLLEGQEWKKRILMIRSHGRLAWSHSALSLSLIAALAITVLVGASAQSVLATQPTKESGDGIRVESYTQPAPWLGEIEKKLSTHLDSVVSEGSLLAVARGIGERCGLAVHVPDDDLQAFEGEMVGIHLSKVSVREAFAVVARLAGEYECLPTASGVEFAPIGSRRSATETRFYGLGTLLDFLGGEDREQAGEGLVDLIRHFGAAECGWDREGFGINMFRDLLVVKADAQTHAWTKSFLEQLNSRRERSTPAEPKEWEAAVRSALDREIDLSTQEISVMDLAKLLRAQVGLTLVYSPSDRETRVNPASGSRTVRALLEEVAYQIGRAPAPWNGAIRLAETPYTEIGMFEIADLIEGPGADAVDLHRNNLFDMVRGQVRPETWDAFPMLGTAEFRGLMVVRQSPEALDEIRAMLSALGRAMHGR